MAANVTQKGTSRSAWGFLFLPLLNFVFIIYLSIYLLFILCVLITWTVLKFPNKKNGLVRLFSEHLIQRSIRSCSGMFFFSPFAFARFSFDSCCSFICDVALVAREALLCRSSASVVFFLGECASFRLQSISSRRLLLSLPTLCFILKRHDPFEDIFLSNRSRMFLSLRSTIETSKLIFQSDLLSFKAA